MAATVTTNVDAPEASQFAATMNVPPAVYAASLRGERAGVEVKLAAAKTAGDTSRSATYEARLKAIDAEIARAEKSKG